MPIPAGPFEEFPLAGGKTPLYLIPFDKRGRCEGPQTREHCLNAVRTKGFTDIHIFSHGWNNVFKEALGLYREFFSEYFALRRNYGLDDPSYRPLLIGIIWPSTALMSADESGPRFAATTPREANDLSIADEQLALRELVGEIAEASVQRFYDLVAMERALSRSEALELARILLPIFEREDASADNPDENVDAEKLVKAWEKTAARPAAGRGGPGALPGGPGALPRSAPASNGPAAPQAAGGLDFLNPKEIVRKASVYLMKDRAGTVGANGVGPLLKSILEIGAGRVHLTGHSYGGKVVLSALTVPDHGGRKVHSVLLLQPAVNHLCFAAKVQGRVGGYRPALDRAVRPIYTTFSSNDAPLSKFFHLAVRRDGDLAEQRIAAAPSLFAALGGFGPGGLETTEMRTLEILTPGIRYPAPDPAHKVYALDGGANKRITGHGDVRNECTEWAQIELTRS